MCLRGKYIAAILLGFLLLSFSQAALALTPEMPLVNSADEARANSLFTDIRCVVCHGESIADSPAEMARDMRAVIRNRVAQGDSNEAILTDFASRYGDAILMRPPLKSTTWGLWFGPLILLLFGALLARLTFRKKGV